MPLFNFVRSSSYHDSVTLMRVSRDLAEVPGVRRAAAMMGTPQNRALMKDAGLLTPAGEAAGPTDLVIAVAAEDEAAAAAARAAVDAALGARRARPTTPGIARPRTLASALAAMPDANLALISVPGLYAAAQARRALGAGLHVMLFSDNVALEDEIALKRLARERDRLLMGPDCGTAIVDGVPLGFANAVPRGRIGIAAASGTGLQEIACRLAAAGEGISQAIGVGGRDLTDEVGGLMMERALAALGADLDTEVLCVVGKPPGPAVLRALAAATAKLARPCVAHFTARADDPVGATWHRAATLEDAALAAVALARGERPRAVEFSAPAATIERLVEDATRGMSREQRFVRGVFAGGTLAGEARGLLAASLDGVAPTLTAGGDGHRVVDLGDDVFTVGRPHPMIDGTIRREWIEREAADPATAVVVLDVVLGFGAHPDPAGEVIPAIVRARRAAETRGRRLAVVASVCGTDADPQPRRAQVAALEAAGIAIMPSNAQAARLAARIAGRLARDGRG